MFCSIPFSLTHKPSIVQNFPSVVSFQFPNIQSDLSYAFNFSTITLFYSFLNIFSPHFSFSRVQYFVCPVISSVILFFFFTFDIILYLTSFFHVDFSLPAFLLIQSPRFWFSFVFSGKKCCYNFFSCFSIIILIFFLHVWSLYFLVRNVAIIFFLFFYHLLDFSFSISILYVIIQRQCYILHFFVLHVMFLFISISLCFLS